MMGAAPPATSNLEPAVQPGNPQLASASVEADILLAPPPTDDAGLSQKAAVTGSSQPNHTPTTPSESTSTNETPKEEAVLSQQAAWTSPNLPRSTLDWAALDPSFNVAHEASPLNVPAGYDWAHKGVLHAGNGVPAGWKALTAWGHVFNSVDAVGVPEQAVEIRQHQTYLCTVVNGETRWTLAQQGAIEGAAFRADFQGNENVAARVSPAAEGAVRVSFDAGRAFHFWPATVRAALPNESLCGMLVLAQARAVAPDGRALPDGTRPALLMGLGADYWTTRTAPWDNFKTSASVGVGRLRLITPHWQWFGMSTASAADLRRLRTTGTAN